MERKDLAVEYKHGGCNCAQAVLLAFKDELNLTEEDLKKMGAAFGVGMGCMEATCGALCASQMILGLKQYQGKPILKDAASLAKAFEAKCGATICKELKGIETGQVLCDCDSCVRNAVELAEQAIEK